MDRVLLRRARLYLVFTIALCGLIVTQHHALAQTTPPAQTGSDSPADRTTLNYTQTPNGSILVSVQFNTFMTGTFLLDSGFSQASITDTFAQKLGLTPELAMGDYGKPVTLEGKPAERVTTSMQIGQLSIASVPLIVIDEDTLHLSSLVGQHIDGVIGANIIEALPCFLDFQKHQVTFFYKSPVTAEQRQSLGMQGVVGCPLTFSDADNLYLATVHLVNGSHSIDANLVPDTGGHTTLITGEAGKLLQLSQMDSQSTRTAFGVIPTKEAILPSLSFVGTPISVRNSMISYMQGSGPDDFPPGIGRDILSQFQVLLDFGGKMMYLKSVSLPHAAPLSIKAHSSVFTVPLVSKPGDPPVVQVTMGGKITGDFLLGTSLSGSSVTEGMATKLGLPTHPAQDDTGNGYKIAGKAVQELKVHHMTLGGQVLTDTPFLVLPPSGFAGVKYPVDGMLGMDVLGSHAFLLDMSKHQVTFWDNGAFSSDDLKDVGMADAVPVPLSQFGGMNVFTVSATFTNGKTTAREDLEIDTGQPANYLSADTVTHLGLSAFGKPLLIPDGKKTYTINHTTVPQVSLGPLKLKDFYTAYAAGTEPPGVLHHLGMRFFSQNRVLFDFAHQVMYVKPNPPSIPAAATSPAPGTSSKTH